MNKLIELLSIEAKEISDAFKKASLEGAGTPQEISDRRESAFKSFLEKYFPYPYWVVKGNICDSYGNTSQSIDCIVLNPCHPYTIDKTNKKASIIFADGVDYAFEVKSDLSNKSEIERALRQIQSVKRLRRVKHGLLIQNKYTPEQIECAKTIPCVIIAEKTYSDIRMLIESIYSFYLQNNVPPIEQFDLMLINLNCIIYNFRKNMYVTNDIQECITFWDGKENSLAALLFHINNMPHCEAPIGMSVMDIYLKDIKPDKMTHFPDLDEKYLSKKGNS